MGTEEFELCPIGLTDQRHGTPTHSTTKYSHYKILYNYLPALVQEKKILQETTATHHAATTTLNCSTVCHGAERTTWATEEGDERKKRRTVVEVQDENEEAASRYERLQKPATKIEAPHVLV